LYKTPNASFCDPQSPIETSHEENEFLSLSFCGTKEGLFNIEKILI
jgi:hypothetical protein